MTKIPLLLTRSLLMKNPSNNAKLLFSSVIVDINILTELDNLKNDFHVHSFSPVFFRQVHGKW